MFSRSSYGNDPCRLSRKRKKQRNINKKIDTPTKSYLKESMLWYEQDGLLTKEVVKIKMLHVQHPATNEN